MNRIAIVTTTRAEYGLLSPLIRRIRNDEELELELLVTGAHLSEKQGLTIQEIIGDGFEIAHKIPILAQGDTPYDVSRTMANAIKNFARCFQVDRPDMLFIAGDRTEMLGIACAAMNERIPMAHYSGGEVTEGAVDDCVRHSLTKMSYLHFTSTELYRQRVIQLGEDPGRVYNVGALGMENIRNAHLMSEKEIRNIIGVPLNQKYAVVTFHPVTLEDDSAGRQAMELCEAMDKREDYFYLITKANVDTGGNDINRIFEGYARKRNNVKLADSLGMIRYLSAVKYASFVLGNSSSGIVEAPILGIPTINIGDRQKGRLMVRTIINCQAASKEIIESIYKAERMPREKTQAYGAGDGSRLITEAIKSAFKNGTINLKKEFYEKK